MLRPERPIYTPLVSSEALQGLPDIKNVASLGLDAVARIKLFAHEVPFTAYLCSFDGDDTCYGLTIATPSAIRLGELYLSGLDAADMIWDAQIEQDKNFEPTPLWTVLAKYADAINRPSEQFVERNRQLRLLVRAQVCLVVGREYHHPSTYPRRI